MRAVGGLTLMLVFAAAMPAPATAQLSQNWTWCVNKDNAVSFDLAISGCTAVIQSGKESKKNLSIAFNNRGNAHYLKKDYDRAIADYNESIRLDANATRPSSS